MISSQDGNPTILLLKEIFNLAVDDVRYERPTACTKNELKETKRTAEDFFKTKFYNELCDLFRLPSNRVAKLVLAQKDTIKRPIYDELS